MITLNGSTLVLRFPEVHVYARTEIEFQRTLRIPDDTKEYPLPPGLGPFPIRHIEDFKRKLPDDWLERGGVMLPLFRSEAMWISFRRSHHDCPYPFAIKVAAGKINALSGQPWRPELSAADHDYVVVPGQRWLDGFCVAKDQVRQFVAMPLGAGYSAEEQITGKAEHGGLQMIAYPMKAATYDKMRRARSEVAEESRERSLGSLRRPAGRHVSNAENNERPIAMGLAPGGRMRQQIYADPYGLDAWEQNVSGRCFVTLVDAIQWHAITGGAPRTKPPTAEDYTAAGLPWFDYYDDAPTLAGAPALSGLRSVAEIDEAAGGAPFSANGPLTPSEIIPLGPHGGKTSSG